MPYIKSFSVFFLLCFMTSFQLLSQEKFEKEYRVKPTEVPKKAFELIEKWNFKKKLKWYAEESNDGKTFEAKVRFKKHKFSIEFSEKGHILDVEKTIRFSELSSKSREQIQQLLAKKFKKHRIKKVQIQFLGTKESLYDAVFDKNPTAKNVIVNYELVVKGKKEKENFLYEILLDAKLRIIKELKFSASNSVNLEF